LHTLIETLFYRKRRDKGCFWAKANLRHEEGRLAGRARYSARGMKKYFSFAVFLTIVGGNQLNAQSINYRTLSAEQIQAMAEQKRQQYDDAKSRADKTKDEFKNAQKEYKAKQKEYKELNKLRKQRKKELKEVEKALKLRSKLRKLSN